jgi:hypothetical protein
MSNHPTIKEEGYIYVKYENGVHHLKQPNSDIIEKWVANKGHANAGLKYKNTDLEFLGTYREKESDK